MWRAPRDGFRQGSDCDSSGLVTDGESDVPDISPTGRARLCDTRDENVRFDGVSPNPKRERGKYYE